VGFLSRKHDAEALTATGIADIVHVKPPPGFTSTQSHAGGTMKVSHRSNLPFGHSTLQLRVTPDDGGAEFASEADVEHGDNEMYLDERHQTYVRYDPAHPEQCVIDRDRLEREFGHQEGRRTTVPRQPGAGQEWAKHTIGGEQPAWVAAPDAPPSPAATAGGTGLAEELARLGGLHESGMLTDDEFARAKARLIDGGA